MSVPPQLPSRRLKPTPLSSDRFWRVHLASLASINFESVSRNRIATSAIFSINGVATGLWAVQIPGVAAKHQIDPFMLGLVLLTLALGAIAAMPLSGYASGRFGSDRAAKVFGGAYLAVMSLPILAPSLPLLFGAALLYGLFNGGLDVAMNAQATDVERARCRPTMSSFHGFWSLGGLVGASAGGFLLGSGFRGASIMPAAALVFGLILGLIWDWVRPLPDSEQAQAQRLFAMPTGSILILGLIATMALVVEGACADWSALHLIQNTGASPATAAAGFAALSLAMAGSRFVGDAVIERLGRVRVLRFGGLLIAIGFLLAVLVPIPLLAAAGFGLVGLGAANVLPVMIGEASRMPGVAAGAGVAAVTGIGYFGFLAGPPLIGLLAQGIGLASALGTLALVGVLLMFISGRVVRQR